MSSPRAEMAESGLIIGALVFGLALALGAHSIIRRL